VEYPADLSDPSGKSIALSSRGPTSQRRGLNGVQIAEVLVQKGAVRTG